mmetsp:Transcript_34365/g.75013  ORF Transcript_34365/g.75013 Transcript_34365/m.75013 type:complete len:251 (-) Transcript_34365:310-1062(-)
MAAKLGSASRNGSGFHLSMNSKSSQRMNSLLSQSSPLKRSLTCDFQPFLRIASANSGNRSLLFLFASSLSKASLTLPKPLSTHFLNSARVLALWRSSSSNENSSLSSLSKACQRSRFSFSQPICDRAFRNCGFRRVIPPSKLKPWRQARMKLPYFRSRNLLNMSTTACTGTLRYTLPLWPSSTALLFAASFLACRRVSTSSHFSSSAQRTPVMFLSRAAKSTPSSPPVQPSARRPCVNWLLVSLSCAADS